MLYRQKPHMRTGVDSTYETLCKNNLDNGLSPTNVYYQSNTIVTNV
jgi:hypothetical protein